MKNMFKVLGIIALSAVIGFAMTACGGDDGGGGGGKTVTVTITDIPANITGEVYIGITFFRVYSNFNNALSNGHEQKKATINNGTASAKFDWDLYGDESFNGEQYVVLEPPSDGSNGSWKPLYSKQRYSPSSKKITVSYDDMATSDDHPDAD